MASSILQELTELHQLTQEAKPTVDYYLLIEKYNQAASGASV